MLAHVSCYFDFPVHNPSILNVCFSDSWGGLEMSSVKMTRLFAAASHPSTEICRPGSPIHRALDEQGLASLALPRARYFAPRTTRAIRDFVRANDVRAVYLHALKDLWLVAPALWKMPHVRLFGFARMFLRGVNKKDFLHRRLYARLDKLIALSHPQRDALLDCLPIARERTVVIPNGVDVERFQPRPRRDDLRAEWGVTPRQTLFGLIGRLDEQKGSLEFVEAAARLRAEYPDARFVLVGENTLHEGEFDQKVRGRIRDLGLQSTVILTPFRRDVPAVMNALDVFVMPSYEENFGNVLLEALASGLPSIGTDSGGTPEILSGGEVGLLCEPRSSESLAAAARTLLADPDRARDLGRRARRKALDEYEMGRVFERVRALAVT